MIFRETPLKGAFIINLEKKEDDRGYFARTWCENEFKDYNIAMSIVQTNISYNRKKGALRGMHYQISPHAEAKVVSCLKGNIFDVIIDLRPDSKTFKKYFGIELTEKNKTMLYIPEGLAHGFITLEDNTEVNYLMSDFYHPEYARAVRWNDPAFGIKWPLKPITISQKDRLYPDFK